MKNGTRSQIRALNYLRDHNVANLATGVGTDIWASAVFYANDGFTLYFLSSPDSRHCLNFAKNPQVAVTIQEDYADWLEIKGIQIEGVVSEISGSEETEARRIYGEKFPVVGTLALAPAAIVKALANVRWFKIVPKHLYFIDNSVSLGHREEIDLNLPQT